jgi:hypothetical protein
MQTVASRVGDEFPFPLARLPDDPDLDRVRMKWNSFALTGRDRTRFDPIEHPAGLPDDQLPHEIEVRAKVSRGGYEPARLIITLHTGLTLQALV